MNDYYSDIKQMVEIKQGEPRDYDALLGAGNKAQLEALKENGHGVDDIDVMQAFYKIREELNKLNDELVDTYITSVGVSSIPKEQFDLEAVRHEAAKIANFAHMIILYCDKHI